MPGIGTRAYAGMMPRIHPELLSPSAAQLAVNFKLTSGNLEPWRAPATVLTLASVAPVQTLYRFGQNIDSATQFWLEFDHDADVVKGPVAGDTQERTYWTDGVYPKKTDSTLATVSTPYPTNFYRLGIPAPLAAPSVSVTGTATNATNDPITTSAYVTTYVTGWGEESAPSPPSSLVSWQPGQAVSVGLPSALTGEYNVTHVRIYRSNTGTSRTSYQYVDERAIGTPSYSDSTLASNLGEVLATFDWEPPPAPLRGLCYVGNEILAGFFGNTLCFCEPGAPYAWPVKYQLATDSPIIGIGAFGQSLLVGCTRGCYIVSGVDPSAMQMDQVQEAQSCASKRSIVEMLGGVVWASPDGLFHIGPGGPRNLTEAVLTRDEWQAYKPESVKGCEIDGRYVATFDTGSRQGVLIFTFGDSPSFIECDQFFTAAYKDKLRDTLYVVQTGNVLRRWDGGAYLIGRWKSKEQRFPQHIGLSCARVEASAYPVTFRLFADGVQRGPDITVANNLPFRLPAGRAYTYAYEVVAAARIIGSFAATSISELGAV